MLQCVGPGRLCSRTASPLECSRMQCRSWKRPNLGGPFLQRSRNSWAAWVRKFHVVDVRSTLRCCLGQVGVPQCRQRSCKQTLGVYNGYRGVSDRHISSSSLYTHHRLHLSGDEHSRPQFVVLLGSPVPDRLHHLEMNP